jgi:hypothetical protein
MESREITHVLHPESVVKLSDDENEEDNDDNINNSNTVLTDNKINNNSINQNNSNVNHPPHSYENQIEPQSQSVSPMMTSPILTNSPNLLGAPEDFTQFSPLYAHFQPSPNGYYPDKDQVASHQLDTQLIAMSQDPVSPMGEWFPSSTEMVPHHSKAIPINKRTARHPSISGCSRSPYSRGDPMTFSPTSEISSSLMGGSFTTTPSMVAGFSQEQLPAAQAILQFIADRPHEPIPSHLINDQLVEISTGHGYCLIGNCGIKRAMQKCNPESDASKETLKKRADHLYDHIRDKHFNCRPFQCIQWYVLLSTHLPFASFLSL